MNDVESVKFVEFFVDFKINDGDLLSSPISALRDAGFAVPHERHAKIDSELAEAAIDLMDAVPKQDKTLQAAVEVLFLAGNTMALARIGRWDLAMTSMFDFSRHCCRFQELHSNPRLAKHAGGRPPKINPTLWDEVCDEVDALLKENFSNTDAYEMVAEKRGCSISPIRAIYKKFRLKST